MLLACVVAGPDAHAGAPTLSQGNSWQQRVDRERLYLDPTWLTLLAYQPRALRTGWTSEADRPGFFLSEQGRRDPRAEMLAEIEAMFVHGQDDEDPDRSARCRFPARFTWLRQRLGFDGAADVRDGCPALRAWYEAVAADRVTISFASAYLESPSSMFGHTFLRFERDGVPTLMTATINYEADSSRSTGSVEFVARGLFGGFPGIADLLPFYRRLRIYGDVEGRDIWEYPLHLDAPRIELLLYGVWEAKDGAFDYYFVGENCSYRTLALLAVVVPEAKLLEPFPLEVLPIETIRVLRDRGLIGDPVYRPSAVRSLLWNTRDFTADERRVVVALAHGTQKPEVLANLPRHTRARILQAAADYSSILIHRGRLDFETRDRVTQELIHARLAVDLAMPPDPVEPPPSPDTGHGGRMISVGWVNRGGRDAASLGVAGFQHERVDPLAGYPVGAEVVVLGGRVYFDENEDFRLDHFDLLRIESTTASSRFFEHPAWALRVGAVRKDVDHARPLMGTLSYSHGRAYDIGVGVIALTLGASLDTASALRAGIAMEAVVAARLTRQHEWLSYEAFAEYGGYLFGQHSDRVDYGIGLGTALSRRHGLVLELRRGGADSQENQAQVELRTFF